MPWPVVLLLLMGANVVLFGWIATNGRLPGRRRRQPTRGVARWIAAVGLSCSAVATTCAAWLFAGDNGESNGPTGILGYPLIVSAAAYGILGQVVQWRFPLERDAKAREARTAMPPIRWRWMLKAFALTLAGLVALIAVLTIVGRVVSAFR